MSSSEAIEAYVRKRAEKLEDFTSDIMSCRVAIEIPHRHKLHGYHFRVRIDLKLRGAELVVGRDPAERKEHEDVHAAIDAAFDTAKRLIEDFVRKRRGDVKSHVSPMRQGRVTKLFAYEGFGFIETPTGEEVYFHANSVPSGGFSKLEIGSRVRFLEEEGDRGPQASRVAPLG
jgi:cold shock CspA family protein